MGISWSENGSAVTLKISAEALVKDEAMLLKKTAGELIDSGFTDLRLDLSETLFIDSSGIGKLLFLNKTLEQKDGNFEIVSISRKLYEFLESLAITKVMKVAGPTG